VALGALALSDNTSGSLNVAAGRSALWHNTTGSDNVAVGASALRENTSGSFNLAASEAALLTNTTGSENVAIGHYALSNNTIGNRNIAIGREALLNSVSQINNVAIGYRALSAASGSNNIAIGTSAGSQLSTGSNNIIIGSNTASDESNTIRIGGGPQNDTYIAGIYGSTSSGGVAVYVDASGHLGTLTSSARFKQDIRDMGDRSEVLMKLRPVTFRYREGVSDEAQLLQYGLVAEEVEKVAPGLVMNDEHGDPYTVRYQFLAPMLLNEVQQQRAHIQELTARLERLEELLASQRVASR
jgi:hypothetical protein